jgi:hypothetical protein
MVERKQGLADMPATEPVVVSSNQSLIDGLQAAGRYALVLITALIALAGFLRVHDFAGMVGYVQANGGQLVGAVAGLISIGTAAYGVYKTHKRGGQIATVAADPRVSQKIARLK